MGRSERKRSRSRSPDRERDRDRSGRRSGRSRSRSPDDRKSRRAVERSRDRRHRSRTPPTSSRSTKRPRDDKPNREKLEDIVGKQSYKNFDMEKQNELLDKVMQERRERVEKWRLKQKTSTSSNEQGDVKLIENNEEEKDSSVTQSTSQPEDELEQLEKKKWSLDDELEGDDDEDDDEQLSPLPIEDDGRELLEPTRQASLEEDKIESVVFNEDKGKNVNGVQEKPSQVEKVVELPADEEDEIDPLDAYMMSIQAEVKKSRKQIVKNKNSHVSVVVGVAKKKTENKRGELLEQNEDGLGFATDEVINKEDELTNVMETLNAKTAKKPQTISLADISYAPFRKNFYIEVPEIAKLSQTEVETFKTEMEGIKTKGKGCPRPIRTWAQCGVSKKVFDVLKKSGFEKPTPIQCQAIPAIMSGRDLIGIAKTGSGKTLAFLLPMFRHILDQPELESGDGPIAVIMTPTRELAVQIYSQCKKFAKPLGLRTVAVYGGTPISEQIGDLKPGAEIVVCTPGRMIDMLAANSGRVTNLRRCTYIVLDEADRMFDMGFEPQVMRIIDGIRPDRQTVMFSATFPRLMEALARRILEKPIEIIVGGRSVVCKDVEQNVVVIEDDNKFLKLLEVLGKFSNDGSAICFVDKQEHADWLLKELMHASYTVLALHGGIDQSDRDSTISDFKAGKVNVLVATSVAARGLDVKHCILVVNYDCPNHYEDYVHRCGRTGRAGNKGYAYTFITPEQGRYSNDLIRAFEQSETPVPEDLQKLFNDYKVEQEALGKTVKSSSGFSGKGFKFDQAEAAAAVEKKKAQKAALGLQDSDEEEEEGEKKTETVDIDNEIESLLAPKKKVVLTPAAPSTSTSAPGVSVSDPVVEKTIDDKMEQVRKAASKISFLIPTAASSNDFKSSATAHTAAILKGDAYSLGDIASAVNAKSLAEQRAEALNAKLNYTPRDDEPVAPPPPPPPTSTNTFQRYEEELEINDFPQQARWRVTGKDTIAQISEISEAGITVRGSFFPQGKEPTLGERKLYLAIEATSERAIAIAKAEIIRIIKEEMARVSSSGQPFKGGRYKVL